MAREKARPASELQHRRRLCRLHRIDDRPLDEGHLGAPRGIVVFSTIEPSGTKPPRIVFGGTRAVVRDLLVDQRLVSARRAGIVIGTHILRMMTRSWWRMYPGRTCSTRKYRPHVLRTYAAL